ncbi:MAG: hypothetical protein WBH04_07040 [Albidovulum sp.]
MPMERAERIGLIVSGGGHGALLLWALLGGIFFSHDLPSQITTTEVSLMSSAEFAAVQAAAPTAPTESPPQPSVPAAAEPTPTPEPQAAPDTATPTPPAPQAEPDAAPDVSELAPVGTEVVDTPPPPQTPPVEEPSPVVQPTISQRPKPKPAPRVAPVPTEEPAPDAQTAETAQAETAPTPSETVVPETPTEAEAPPETGDVLLTEANKDQTESASSAPLTSGRPRARPELKPAAAPAPAAEATETATAEAVDTDAAVLAALDDVLSGAASDEPAPGTGSAASGPPMSGGEKDALRFAVQSCWTLGAVSTEALQTIVTVRVNMAADGKPDVASIRMSGYEGGSDASAQIMFRAAKSAIVRCTKTGYPLPAEKYEQWKDLELVFDPNGMRAR